MFGCIITLKTLNVIFELRLSRGFVPFLKCPTIHKTSSTAGYVLVTLALSGRKHVPRSICLYVAGVYTHIYTIVPRSICSNMDVYIEPHTGLWGQL